jgi:hypothetical protein
LGTDQHPPVSRYAPQPAPSIMNSGDSIASMACRTCAWTATAARPYISSRRKWAGAPCDTAVLLPPTTRTRVRDRTQVSRQYSPEARLTSRALFVSLVVIPAMGNFVESTRYRPVCGFSGGLWLFLLFEAGNIPVCWFPCGSFQDVDTMSVQLL